MRLRLAPLLAGVVCACAPVASAPSTGAKTSRPAPVAASTSSAAPADGLEPKIDAIFAEYAHARSPGCAVGVFRAGTIVFSKAYGFADLEHDLRNTQDTVFDIGSTSKQFTATAIALLALDGKLSLDDDVRKYIPELPDYGTPITLRHLVQHTSGLRDYFGLLQMSGLPSSADVTPDDVLSLLAHQRALNFRPGTQALYSNSGYFLLSRVVVRVSGKPFAAFVKERIFARLGMKDSRVRVRRGEIVAGRAIGYEYREDDGTPMIAAALYGVGAGGIQTTLADLARWDASFYDPALLAGQPLLDMLRTQGKLADGSPREPRYAMGLYEDDVNGVAREWHGGGGSGYESHLVRYPTERLTVAVLCNDATAGAERRADAVAALYIPKLAPPPLHPGNATAVDLARFVGTYVDPLTFDVRVVRLNDGVLKMTFGPDPGEHELVGLDGRTCAVRGGLARYVLEPGSTGAPARLVRSTPKGPDVPFARVELALDAKALGEYAGRYGSDEVWRDTELAVREGRLFGGPAGVAPDLALAPIARDVFLGQNGVRFHFSRDARGRVANVVVDAGLVKGMRLTKR